MFTRALHLLSVPSAALMLLGLVWAELTAQSPGRGTEWHQYAADVQATKYSPLSQITEANVKDLAVAWRWPTADRALQASNPLWSAGRNEETPLMANGVLYTVTALGLVAALDPATGQTRWIYDPESYKAGTPNNVGFIQRGMAYWTDGTLERVLVGTGDAYLISIDVRTGKPDAAFGNGGKVDLVTGIPGAIRATNFSARRPLVAGNVIVMGSNIADTIPNQQMPPGDVQAFDVRTGSRLWTFHTIPRRGEFGYDTWLNESAESHGSANVWAGMAYDPELDYVYLPTSSADNNGFGGRRPGSNLFSDTLLCLEAKTGKRVWHFQTIHHDIWDYDLPATPILGDITVNGRLIKSVMLVSKQAFTYTFDRRTGAPVWPIEERPVPQAPTMPGEWTSPTQPIPTKPPPFDLQGTLENNLTELTPELKRRAREQWEQFDHGPLYQPRSPNGGVTIPSAFGSANWGGAGFDPETSVLYIPSVTQIAAGRPRTVAADGGAATAPNTRANTPNLADLITIDGLSIFKPPYSRVTAIDMNKGDHLWVAALGNGPRNHPLLKNAKLPPLGDGIHRASVLVTKTLLFVNVSRLINNGVPQPPTWAKWADPNADRKLIFVFDKRTGRLLREIEMDGLSAAAPMTYLHGGKQYIVVAIGGGRASEVVALSLPGTVQGSGR